MYTVTKYFFRQSNHDPENQTILKHLLTNGTKVQALKHGFHQEDVFELRQKLSKRTNLLKISQVREALGVLSGPEPDIRGEWPTHFRAKEYAFIRNGIEEDFRSGHKLARFGKKIIHVDRWHPNLADKRLISVLNIPDVPVDLLVSGKTFRIGLRRAYGLGVVRDISNLDLKVVDFSKNFIFFEINFKQSFNPATDLVVVDVPRNGEGLVNEDGIPIRTQSCPEHPNSVYLRLDSRIRKNSKANGWHGSLSCIGRNTICAEHDWLSPSVILIQGNSDSIELTDHGSVSDPNASMYLIDLWTRFGLGDFGRLPQVSREEIRFEKVKKDLGI